MYILDINVPNIDGLELLNLIYEKNNSSKVLIMSANTDIYSLSTAYRLGCIEYLKKPFHLEELRIKISKQVVDKQELLDSVMLKDDATLTKKEKIFLTLLLTNRDRMVSYALIGDGVYDGNIMTMDSLRALVRRLRAKLVENLIQNVLEEGYKINS